MAPTEDLLDAPPRFWACRFDSHVNAEDRCWYCARRRDDAEAIERRGTFQVAAVIHAHFSGEQEPYDRGES